MEEKLKYKIPEPKRTIDKRTGKKGYKIYDFVWYENGKRRKSDTKWHLTKQECISEAEDRIKGSTDVVYLQNKLKIRDLIKEYQLYIRDVDIDEVAPATKKNRYDNCNALLRYSSEQVLNEKISTMDVELMKLWMNTLRKAKSTRSGTTLSKEYTDGLKNLISLILRYADEKNYFFNSMERYNGLLNYLYNDTRTKKVKGTKKEFRYMTYDEFRRFATCCLYGYDLVSARDDDEEDKEKLKIETDAMKVFNTAFEIEFERTKFKNVVYFFFFVCMFFLGTRTEECRVLTYDDVDFEAGEHEGRITISKAFTSYYFKSDNEAYLHKMRTKTEGSVRKIPIHPMLKHLLAQYFVYLKKIRPDNKYLFPGDDNGYLSYAQINHKIERMLIKAGMENKKFTKHDFRRSCAMYLCYELKLPRDQAIAFFGWTSTDMLDAVYAKFNEIQRAEMLEKNLDEVGFFKNNSTFLFMDFTDKENRKVYFGKEAELKAKESKAKFYGKELDKKDKLDEYGKHYHKDDAIGGYEVKIDEEKNSNS